MPTHSERSRHSAEDALLKTLLVSDLVGSTRLVEELGDTAAAELLRRHDGLARDLLAEHQGREIDKTDGFLLLFERPFEAVLFALGYHQALNRLSEEQDRAIEARVGIHVGEVVLHENPLEHVERGAKPLEVEGLAKPIAARLMTLARGGQTLLTRSAFDLARRGAVGVGDSDQLRWLAHGAYRLAGVVEPVDVFEVGREGLAPLAPPADSEKARRVGDQAMITGWRPAPELSIPHRSHWRLEQKLGEGGFGEVWLAAHQKTGDRRVFKFCYDLTRLRSLQREITLFRLIKEELGEREDITRILDWSFDEAPYFIEAEYTSGGSLPEWLEAQGGVQQTPIETRLEIVAQVATALAAAHSIGVLHKDVKASNVLIRAGLNSAPQAQLTDFGVGHVIERDRLAEAGITVLGLTEQSDDSAGSSMSGTRLYMPPEVLEGKPATLQGDIYALGVMLYQIVVGDFRRSLASGWRRDVEDQLLAEDIACFVDRSPARRPASAREVAERLRTLETRRKQSEEAAATRQALERSQRRRRLSATIAGVAVAVLLLVSIFAVWAMQARQEEAQARRAAEKVSGFLVELFEVADPFGHSEPGTLRGETLTAREILDHGAAKLTNGFDGEPLIQARLMNTVGDVYRSLGLYDSAKPLVEQALALRRQALGDEHLDVAESLNSLAELLSSRGDYEGAEVPYRESLAMRRLLLGDEHSDVAESLSNLAELLRFKGDYEGAEPLYRESLAILRRSLGSEHPDVASNLHNLARLLRSKGDYDAAEPLLRESLAMSRRLLGAEHPDVAVSLNDLAGLLRARGDYESAEPLYRESLAMSRRLLGVEHPRVAWSLNNLAGLLRVRGDYEGAESLYRESFEMRSRLLGIEHPDVAGSLKNLALVRIARGAPVEGEELIREALAVYRKAYPPDHWRTASAESILGACLTELGRYQEAEPLLLKSYPIVRDKKGASSPYVQAILERLAVLYEAWGKQETAAGFRAQWIEAGGAADPE